MRIGDIFRKLFFKRRTIFFISKREYISQDLTDDNFEIRFYSKNENLDIEVENYLCERIPKPIVESRRLDGNCFLAIAFVKENQQLAGFCWALGSKDKTLYHDSFFIPKNSALLINGYVEPEYRRRGIFRLLVTGLLNYMFKFPWCQISFGIVEKVNLPSSNGLVKFGFKKYSFNYLIKFFKINVFSIYKLKGKFLTKFVLWKTLKSYYSHSMI